MSGDGVVLHRCPVPTDVLCPCGKVARELRSLGIEFDQVVEPLLKGNRDSIEELTGQRRLPVLEIGGEAICDSHRIIERLALEEPVAQQADDAGEPHSDRDVEPGEDPERPEPDAESSSDPDGDGDAAGDDRPGG